MLTFILNTNVEFLLSFLYYKVNIVIINHFMLFQIVLKKVLSNNFDERQLMQALQIFMTLGNHTATVVLPILIAMAI